MLELKAVTDYEKIKQLKKQVDDYETDFDFYSRFVLSPEIEEYGHIDKNLVITNLNGKLKEPERLRVIMDALHILLRYGLKKEQKVLIGYNQEEEAVYQKQQLFDATYSKATRFFMQKYRSFITTAAARGGYLFKELNTKRFRSAEAIEDRTKVKPRFLDTKWNKKSSGSMEDY